MSARRTFLLVALCCTLPGALLAQSSATYRLEEHVFDAGGRPSQGVVSASAGFRLGIDSIGETVARRAQSGTSFRLDGSFAAAYVPPGEIGGLVFLADGRTLQWSPEPASLSFDVYRGPIASLPGSFGDCAVSHVAGTTWSDATVPAAGSGLFYLVTGVSRLREEGTKGRTSGGLERSNPAPCP